MDSISVLTDILIGAVVLLLIAATAVSAPAPRVRVFPRTPLHFSVPPAGSPIKSPCHTAPCPPDPDRANHASPPYQENVQQDIVEDFLDRGELRQLGEPTLRPNGKRIPGLKLDHPRQLAVMSSLVRFSVGTGDTFTTAELQAAAAEALGIPVEDFPLGGLRCELRKLRAKGLVEKLPHSRRYRLLPNGNRICLLFLKRFANRLPEKAGSTPLCSA